MLPIPVDLLRTVAPQTAPAHEAAQARILAALDPVLTPVLAEHAIDTRLRIAHFLAQICHESAGLRTTEEFASGAAYEGRLDLGNTEPGDGRRYKGRGLIQLTGRANYREFGAALGVDLEGEPETAAEPALSLRIACLYWQRRAINDPADRDDLIAVTRRINGGTNGLADRRQYLVRAKDALARLAGLDIAARSDPAARPVLWRGSQNAAVVDLQRALVGRGLPVGIDGLFGPATETAVRTWQARAGLVVDGIVGPRTWASLGMDA